jgi:heme-degrading monooxygenase HmoA
MMTVITETTIQPGKEAQWDQAFAERVQAAKEQPGWHALQVLIPENASNRRVIVGTWEDRAAWARWHTAGAFHETRQHLDQLGTDDGQERWFTVASMAASED